MAGTYTSRGNLYKSAADGNDNVNVVSDLSNNMDRIDALLGWRPVTSGTVPASAFQGAPFYRTDTGKAYINSGVGGSAALTLVQIPVAGAHFDSGMTFNGTVVASGANFSSVRTVAASAAYSSRITTDTQDRWYAQADGKNWWGAGGVSTPDTNLYRSAADTLKTDDSLEVGVNLTVGGSATLDDVIVGGNMVVGAAIVRPQLHAAATVSNSAAEAVICTVTIPANDVVIGSTYRIRVAGVAAVAAATTPTMTFRARLGGLAGTQVAALPAITARSGMSDGYWDVEIQLTCLSTGVSGTWWGVLKAGHNFITGVTTYTQIGPTASGAAITRDTTASQDLVLTVQWSAANASNAIISRTGDNGRVA